MIYATLTKKKQQLDQHRPLPIELVRNLDEWFRIELTYTSNAIEGNTLTRQQTALVVEKGITVGGKSLIEHLEAKNHAIAFDHIKKISGQSSKKISEKEILSIHGLLLKGIDDAQAGRYRTVAVRIAGSRVVLPNPAKVPQLMSNFINDMQRNVKMHPVALAAQAHYQLVTIHPFADGNGRTGRLLMNRILMAHGYPPAIIRTRDRMAYIKSLEKAQLGGAMDDYEKIIAKAVERSLDIYLETIQRGQG